MDIYQIIAIIIFVFGYLAIIFEHALKINKSAAAVITGITLWLLIAARQGSHFIETLIDTEHEIFDIVIFLLAAMALVEMLIQFGLFDWIQYKIARQKIGPRKQFLILTFLIFWLSAIIDNLTATIVGIRIAILLFEEESLLLTGAAIVIAANAGGAFSPIGDVTTIMLWLGGKYNVAEIITRGFFPSIAMYVVSMFFMYKGIKEEVTVKEFPETFVMHRRQWFMISLAMGSFALPLVMSLGGMPPYFGLLIGLGIVWIFNDLLGRGTPAADFFCNDVSAIIQRTDLASRIFFIGILLSVGALSFLGILQVASQAIYGPDLAVSRIVIGNIGLGIFSAVIDNVPLTAIVMKMLNINNPSLWVLLAFTVGTGGSMLSIGSAAGVVAMGLIKDLNFMRYAKIAALPAFLGYVAGVGVWLLQFYVFHF